MDLDSDILLHPVSDMYLFGPGTIPASLLSANSLAYLDLSHNALVGGIQQLPPKAVVFNVSNNALNGSMQGGPGQVAARVGTHQGLQLANVTP